MKAIYLTFFLFCSVTFAQTVSVTDGKSASELVNELLDDACIEVQNQSYSSSQAVAQFSNNGGDFPLKSGVIVRTGIAQNSAGVYTGKNLDSELNKNGDSYLESINNASGQSSVITDVAYLQFDFVPLSQDFSFDFIFASNEYGEWQCVSSDVFAFVLTNLNTGESKNLAVLPGTQTPVSVRSIKDRKYNNSCSSDNAKLFSKYNVTDPSTSTINMRGYTEVLNASAKLIPGDTYKIRVVIGDSNDSNYDSALFLASGSFDAKVSLGPDQIVCDGDELTFDTKLDPSIYQHRWLRNDQLIPGANGNSLTVNQNGTYKVIITQSNSNCLVQDEVIISDLEIKQPQDLEACYNKSGLYNYNLKLNNAGSLGLNSSIFNVDYYASVADLNTNTSIPISQLENFESTGNQTILFKITNKQTGNTCNAVYDFNLNVSDPIPVKKPAPIKLCGDMGQTVNLVSSSTDLVNDDTSNYTFKFYESEEDALNDNAAISAAEAYELPNTSRNIKIWSRVTKNSENFCFAVQDFDIEINPLPPVDYFEDVITCDTYELPPLANGVYMTASNGNGTELPAGTVIDESTTIFIYKKPDTNGCSNQSSFKVLIVKELDSEGSYCGSFEIPKVPVGAFYTAPNGPDGTGIRLKGGDVITTTQTIYYYAPINGILCRDASFQIIILPLPPVDNPQDVITCNAYALPALTNGTYYLKPNGKGKSIPEGTLITKTTTLYIFNDDGTCTNEFAFNVNILPVFKDITACGSYKLPNIPLGGYYTQPKGQGKYLKPGTVLNTSQTVYFYAETTSTPNCSENTSFNVEIKEIPPVDTLNDVVSCEDDLYELPQLTNGSYFTKANRKGNQLQPGDRISESSTIYINNKVNGCSDETSFTVEVKKLPEIENFTDIYTCDSYILPQLTLGKYFTKSGGQGEELLSGSAVTTSQTIYIYKSQEGLSTCASENPFTVYVEGVTVPQFENFKSCDFFELPALSEGNYYTQPNGKGDRLYAGDLITETQTLYIYNTNGSRFVCTAESSFEVKISQTPLLPEFADLDACGSYTLPSLSDNFQNVRYFSDAARANEITSAFYTFDIPGTYSVYVLAEAKDNADCYIEDSFNVTVYPLLKLDLADITICRDAITGDVLETTTITTGLDPEEFVVSWSLNGSLMHTGPNYDPLQAGTYELNIEKLFPESKANCRYESAIVTVNESAIPNVEIRITQPFEDRAQLEVVIAAGYGLYQYRIDGGAYQNSSVFEDVSSGVHVIEIKGVLGSCGSYTERVQVVKYPKYFTPNGDGYHDTWNIFDLADHPEAKVAIFDRFGKLIKEIKTSHEGWDGSYQSKSMPSTDYWFKVTYEMDGIPSEYKAHFTLKR